MMKKAVFVLALSAIFFIVLPPAREEHPLEILRFIPHLLAAAPSAGLDLMIKDFELNDDFELSLQLTNTGEKEYRKGLTLLVKILLNDRKVSEFEHLLQEPLLPYSGNTHTIDPPYRILISGDSRVKATVWPKPASGDVFRDNNTLEQTFKIASFGIEPRESREFKFPKDWISGKDVRNPRRIKVEARWDGGGMPLRLVLRPPGRLKKNHVITGKSPLRMAIPDKDRPERRRGDWRVTVTNLMDQKTNGHLIFRTP